MANYIFPDGRYGDVLQAVFDEIVRAKQKYPDDFNSSHEGFAVLKEEVDEAWDDVKADRVDHAAYEMIQVAAMAVRFTAELGIYPYKEPKEDNLKDGFKTASDAIKFVQHLVNLFPPGTIEVTEILIEKEATNG